MFKQIQITILLVFLLFFACIVSSVDAVEDEPRLYGQNNVLAVGNFNQGTSSSDISLIIRIEAGEKIVVDEGDEVKYLVPLSDDDHSDDWIELEFDDSDWEDGISGIGYGDGDDNTEIPRGNVAVIYSRYQFDVSKAKDLDEITVLVDYDDAYVLWLNGVEIGRSANLAALSPVGEIPAWNVSAVRGTMGGHGALEMAAGQPNEGRWNAVGVRLKVGVEFGGQSAISVESQGKLAATWGYLKAQP